MKLIISVTAAVLAIGGAGALTMTPVGHRVLVRVFGAATVEQRLEEVGPAARLRWAPDFQRAGVSYPPARVTLVGVKSDRELLVYADGRLIRRIPVLGQSGTLGPKLREGDRQVPEGVYAVDSLNANSRFHLSLRIGYPNAEDRDRAAAEGRSIESLGGGIMIHGGRSSVGCLAIGDEAAEDLFTLAAEVGLRNIEVLLAPVDFREADHPAADDWTQAKYDALRAALTQLPPDRGGAENP